MSELTGVSTADDGVLAFAMPAPKVRRRPAARPKVPAPDLPIARIAVDVALPHLDRLFDYLVPEPLSDAVQCGTRVRVRFAGQLVDGFVVERVASSDHPGRLAFLERAVSAESVLDPDVLALARAVADRWAGTLADVLRLAVPPRHAAVEKAPTEPAVVAAYPGQPAACRWEQYTQGPAFLAAVRAGRAPRAIWAALPGDWPADIAAAVGAAVASDRGALIVVPDVRDAARISAALTAALAEPHLVLTADLGPAERYRRFLAIRRGAVRVVVGTRAAAFAPVRRLGLAVIWDDGDDLHAEPRAPYPHARDVLVHRAHMANAGALIGGHAVSAEGARLVATGWAAYVRADRVTVRAAWARVAVADDPAAGRTPGPASRLPTIAWEAARDALASGAPVLVQVPRGGYTPTLACAGCRAAARCGSCAGPVAAADRDSAPACRWCGALAAAWACPACGGRRLRAVVVGATRTAEEFGRAFPGVAVHAAGWGHGIDIVSAAPSIVVATPGAEPPAEGGYGAALLLDGWQLLSRDDLRAGEEALRRWLNAAALVRGAERGGRVVVVADGAARAVQALVRWDPTGHADAELADRLVVGFPPALCVAEVEGAELAVQEILDLAELPAAAQRLGPVPTPDDRVRALVRVTRDQAAALAHALHAAAGVRSARKAAGSVRVRIDPIDIG